jgi:predicted N-formylglutamate amidohydrolase
MVPVAQRRLVLLVSSEHGGNRVPGEYRKLFRGCRALLRSHRGFDPGSLPMARALARHFRAELVYSTTTRLLVDLNRSIGHPRLFSDATRALPGTERQRLVDRHYLPYRTDIERRVARHVAAGRRVVHIASHSFAPALDGLVRNAEVGLLYDPARPGERALARRWRGGLRAADPSLRVRFNYPYAGKADGLTTHLRRRFGPARYIGIELEINQRQVHAGGRGFARLRRVLVETLESALR